MAIHTLEREQVLPVSPEEAWAFFSSPRNLEEITPPDLKFRIVSLDSERMFEGQVIEYRVRVAPLVWTKWVSEIEEVGEGREFVDVQKVGPYRSWHHRHSFEPEGEGIRMRDTIRYEVGFGFLGEIAHALYVRRKLAHIFDHRAQILAERFGKGSGSGIAG